MLKIFKRVLTSFLLLCIVLFITWDKTLYAETTKESSISIRDKTNDKALDLIKLIKKNSIGKCTIISISNYGFRNFTLNWIRSLERNNYTKFVVISLDNELVDFLTINGYKNRTAIVPPKWLEFNLTKSVAEFSKFEYNLITQSKVHIHLNLLVNNVTFLMSDVDIVWLSPHLVEYIEFTVYHSYAHIAFSQDIVYRKLHFNTGFMYVIPTNFTIDLFTNWAEEQRKNIKNSIDQFVLDRILSQNKHNDNRMLPLDKLLFASGYVYFHAKINQRFSIKPLMVHANYIIGVNKKKNFFESNGLWYL